MVENRNVYEVLVVRPDGKSYLEDLKVEGKIILKWTLKI